MKGYYYPEHNKRYQQTPRYKYAKQHHHARKRGIEWLFTFETWWEIWKEHWAYRGRKSGQLVMARHGDIGPYSPDNVKIITTVQNHKEQRRWGS